MRGRPAGDRARRGHRPDRHRRAPLPRRGLLAVVQRPRPPAPGDRRGDARAARPRRPLDDARPHPPRRRRAGGAPGRDRPARARAGSSTPTRARPRSRSRSRWRSSTGSSAAASTSGGPRSSACATPTTATRSARSRSAGSTSSTPSSGRCSSTPIAAEPGDAARHRRGCSPATSEEIAAVVVEPLVQGAAGMLVHPPGYLRARARALRPPRRAADLRRGRDRLRAHRDDVRLRAGGRRARPPLPRQGAHRRLPAAGRDARHRARSTGLPRRPRGVPDLLPRPHLHRQPARLRGRARDPRRLRAGADARSACSPRSALLGELLGRGRRDARGRRGAPARLHGRDRPRRARSGAARSATGSALEARERGVDRPPARRRDRADAAAGDLEAATCAAWCRPWRSRSAPPIPSRSSIQAPRAASTPLSSKPPERYSS